MPLAATLRCPCDGAHLEPAFAYAAPPAGETRFDLGGSAYARGYDRCRLCGHWFGRHDLDLATLYAHDYVAATYGDADGMRRRFERIMGLPPERSDNRARVARVRAFARAHGLDEAARPRLLDVGAGLGVFPAAMREAGWRVTALEPDARTVDHLRAVAGVEARCDDLRDVVPADGPWHAVSFNKVLEHVEDPVPLLRHAGTLLARGGFVYVELPDVAAAVDGPGREEFFIEHHHVFSPASIVLLAERAGLSPVAFERYREPSTKFSLRAFMVPQDAAQMDGKGGC